MVGTWMQAMVQSWLIYRLTHSATWLGVITFVMQGTAFVSSPFAGYVVDRMDRRKLLIWIETAAMIQAFLLAALVFTGTIQIWQIAVLSGVLGVANAFESTTRHSFAFDLVGQADLRSAISLNSVTINLSRVVGPAIAGLIIGVLGGGLNGAGGNRAEGWCFVINALSFIAVIACLALMRESELHRHHNSKLNETVAGFKNLLHQLGMGIQYVKKAPEIRSMLLFTTFMSFVGFPYAVLFPFIATQTLHGDAHTLGTITAAAGVGAVFGGMTASRKRAGPDEIWKKLLSDLFLLGVSYIVLGYSHWIYLSIAASAAFGFFLMGSFPIVNTTIQSLVEDSLRGRVISLYTMSFLGTSPIGALAVGALTDATGVRATTIGLGVFCMIAAVWAMAGRARKNQALAVS